MELIKSKMELVMKRAFVYIIMTAMISFWSCIEEKNWSDPKDDIPPKPVTNVVVENLHGGAMITYTLPDDNDLLGVKATYTLTRDENGVEREAFSSASRDTIVLQGFADTNEYVVSLIAIDQSRNQSTPVVVKINPRVPPVQLIRESLKVNTTFGGLYTSWINTNRENIAISVYKPDAVGDWELYDTYFSDGPVGSYSFRGLDADETPFRIEIRDRWNNYAVPLDTVLKPLFEERIWGRDQVTGFEIWKLFDTPNALMRGDNHQGSGSENFYQVTKEQTFGGTNWMTGDFFLNTVVPDWPEENYGILPLYFTVDMGKKAFYSRLRFWLRNRTPLLSAPTPIIFNVWATNEIKPYDEIGDYMDNVRYWTSWDEIGGTDQWKEGWDLICKAKVELPSGASVFDRSSFTAEDEAFIKSGFEFEIDPTKTDKSYRYIRWEVIQQSTTLSWFQINTIKMWGSYDE